MLIIKNKKDLNKFKKEIGNNIIYEFDEDVVIDFKQLNMIKKYDKAKDEKLKNCKTNYEKVVLVMEEKYRPHIIYKGKSMTFNYDIEWIDRLYLQGNLECAAKVSGDVFQIEKDVKVKDLECYVLECKNLQGEKIIINENLACLGKIECEELYVKHISSFKQLKSKAMAYNGTMFLNISAESEVLDIPKGWRKLT